MLFIGDETHSNGRWPWVTGALILVNLLTFMLQKGLGEKFTYGYSLVPKEIVTGKDIVKTQQIKVKVPYRSTDWHGRSRIQFKETWVDIPQYRGPVPIFLTLLTSMFLHADWFHLIGNMWFLGVFGRNVETALNHGRFVLYYLIGGVIGGLAHVLSDRESIIPCLVASGAISGVMGCYLAIYPLNKVKIWLGLWFGIVEVPAFVALGIWFLWQYVSAFASIGRTGGGVAYWDHLGGFVSGMLLIIGTIVYLKWQASWEAAQPTEDDSLEQAGLKDPLQTASPDDFEACLPARPLPPPPVSPGRTPLRNLPEPVTPQSTPHDDPYYLPSFRPRG